MIVTGNLLCFGESALVEPKTSKTKTLLYAVCNTFSACVKKFAANPRNLGVIHVLRGVIAL